MSTPALYRIRPAERSDLVAIERLAREIWYQHYPGIITVSQIEYMLAQRYRPEVIGRLIDRGEARWDTLEVGGRLAGFMSYEPGQRPGSIKLDKIYVHLRQRGKGYGSALIRHVEEAARRAGASEVYLQVNKHNTASIAAYLRNGFVLADSIRVDIGGGFVMDDYLMRKAILPHAGAGEMIAERAGE
jgi:diamine N-acetyltransferase